jgi:hypothetical protein
MSRYEGNREQNRARMQGAPLNLSPGLAHVIATVLEPRSDESPSNDQFDALLKDERRQLLWEIDQLIAENGEVAPADLGGRIEHIVDTAEARLREAARSTGAEDVLQRLFRLDRERRVGVSRTSGEPMAGIEIDVAAIPRSSSGRRVGLWR